MLAPATLETCNSVFTFYAHCKQEGKTQPALHIIGASYKAVYIGAGMLMSDTCTERHLDIGPPTSPSTWQKPGQDEGKEF